MQPICFLDMDGVCVDFMGGALAVHGRTLPPREIQYDFWHQLGMTAVDFWAPMNVGFWATLPWTHEGRAILAAVEDVFGGRVQILTSAGHENARTGKREWVAREMRKYQKRVNMETKKHLWAHPHTVLVDDHQANVEAFRAAGGEAVLVPRPWNSRKEETDAEGRFDVSAVRDEILAASYRAGGYKPTDDAHRYPLTDPRITAALPERTNAKPYTLPQMRVWVRRGLRDAQKQTHKLPAALTIAAGGSRFYTTTRADVKEFAAKVGRMLA